MTRRGAVTKKAGVVGMVCKTLVTFMHVPVKLYTILEPLLASLFTKCARHAAFTIYVVRRKPHNKSGRYKLLQELA